MAVSKLTVDRASYTAPSHSMERLEAPHLTVLSPHTVPVLNSISRPRAPLLLRLGDHPLTCRLHGPKRSSPEALTLGVVLGDAPALLRLDDTTLKMLTAPLALQRALTTGSTDVSAIWLEYALLEWLELLERMLDVPIHLTGIAAPPTDFPIALSIMLDDSQQSGHLCVSLSPAAAELLAPCLELHCPVAPRPCSSVPWPVQWIGGYQHLALAEVRDLQPGDVVMLNRPEHGSAVLVGDHLVAAVTAQHNSLQLQSRLRPSERYRPMRGDFHMAAPANDTETPTQPPSPSGSDDTRLDQLPVHLVCEFGRLELSLRELQELNQGSVLPLSRPPEQAVDLVINGKLMGKGRLVEIGDGLGVQIERLATDE
ncbi:type III secretion system cytoplasmic ring protein SctQ [Halomonas huangheensis]|uniref:Flagellar motor switch protein FliN-like C-terminal domain-containing protein n=1 Tax=Halomonas huangheensis TaxID=1178482 RepID=W1N9K1_9GAMM|nr:type III secretion system cytoplasmic ring protein SctQ [Halomonas huangheensis]ALM53825.1 hypothetical protein AR456_17275 [Halomonas huangheensis]ERL52237.1 hypothetical protein BJB45_09735 [Halomonas huangheensis]